MLDGFSSAEFLRSDGPTRAKKCRDFAAELQALAQSTNDADEKAGYLELSRQWYALARDIVEADYPLTPDAGKAQQ